MRTDTHVPTLDGTTDPPRQGTRRVPHLSRAAGHVLARLLLLVFVVFCILPVIGLLLAATTTDAPLAHGNPLSFGSWRQLRVNWDELTGFQGDAILLWLRNSAVYAFIALAITLAVSIPAGYAMAMMDFWGRRTLLVITLVVMLMPATSLVVPLFLEINEVHLVGTLWSVVLPFSFYPFGVYLTYIYFSTALPRDLLAADRIDGCSEFG